MTAELLCVDPGLEHPAVALFRDGVLVAATRVKVPGKLAKLPVGERCRAIGALIVGWYTARGSYTGKLDLAVEWMQIYTREKSKGDPNKSLLPLVGIDMMIVGLLHNQVGVVHSPTPAEWAGQVPKATEGDALESPRGAKVWRRLSEEERAVVVVSHDALDAIGIGLKILNRFEPRYPGAT